MSEYQKFRQSSAVPFIVVGVLGLVIGAVLGVGVVGGTGYAAGYRVVDKDTAKTVEELRAWAKNPETERQLREATKRLEKSGEGFRAFGDNLRDSQRRADDLFKAKMKEAEEREANR